MNVTEFHKPDYIYKATLIRVIDGDTADCELSLGFYTTVRKRIRFLDLDTDELRGGTEYTKARAKQAKARVEELIASGDLYIKTEMDATGKYGRVLGTLIVVQKTDDSDIENIININETLKAEGYEKGSTFVSTVKKLVYMILRK